ncbi:NADH-quinone oxidoreductase subunit NuoN [Mycobacterium sp.]|uniref:NADH-quinone oxidoreductase subunit NuoN n=1 Tax=Mycobacterium sp. TaxID=1785 RepID=UPI003D6C3C31
MNTPSVEYFLLLPMLIVFGVAVAGVLLEAFLPRRFRYGAQMTLALGGLVAAFIAIIVVAANSQPSGQSAVLGAVGVDRPALVLQGTVVLVAIMAVIFIGERAPLSDAAGPGAALAVAEHAAGLDSFTPQASAIPGGIAEREAARAGAAQTEVFPLTMLAVGGMMVFPAANDLLTMFIALEVLSLPLYLLCGLARHRRLMSQEAAIKYFLLGAFSSAFFLYGAALLYGATGTLALSGIRDGLAMLAVNNSMALVGVALLAVGLLFKVGAVPFHSWIPDVYVGAPTPITGFMAAATKVAAFGALLRVVYVALPPLHDQWRPVLWTISILTMVVATITAVNQTDVKRMLAYSSVAHVGFVLTGVVADIPAGVSSTLFYLIAYSFSTVGAFAILGLIRSADGREDADMSRWGGLGRRSPIVGVMFSLFLLAFAGIPLTSGFVSKFAVFKAAAEGGAVPLVVIGVVASGVAAYFYVRVILLMFFTEPSTDTPHVVVPGTLSKAAIAVCAAVTVILGIVPQPLFDLVDLATVFVH